MNRPVPVVRVIDDVNTPIITIIVSCSECGQKVSETTYDTSKLSLATTEQAAEEGSTIDVAAWLNHQAWHGKAAQA